jgi:hypothetical protein
MMHDALSHVDEVVEYKTERETEGAGNAVAIPEGEYVALRDASPMTEHRRHSARNDREHPGVNEEEAPERPRLHVLGVDPATIEGSRTSSTSMARFWTQTT